MSPRSPGTPECETANRTFATECVASVINSFDLLNIICIAAEEPTRVGVNEFQSEDHVSVNLVGRAQAIKRVASVR